MDEIAEHESEVEAKGSKILYEAKLVAGGGSLGAVEEARLF